jgi:RNA polymerase sigma-70 factor, ECF subfamily
MESKIYELHEGIQLSGNLLDDFIESRGERAKQIYDSIERYISKRFGGKDFDTEDVMQQLKIKAWESKDKYNPECRLESWLFSIAYNLSVDYLRKNKSGIRRRSFNTGSFDLFGFNIPDKSPNHEYIVEENESKGKLLGKLREGVDRLPNLFKEPLLLVYYSGLKFKDAAEVLDIPQGTLKSRLHKGLNLLRYSLEEEVKRAA